MFGFPNYLHSDQDFSFMSYKLKSSYRLNIASYHGYSKQHIDEIQLTRIWESITLKPHNSADYAVGVTYKKLSHTHWEYVLPDILHSICSLLCLATNCTLHERMFLHIRKTFNGISLPFWVKSGPVCIKCYNRNKNNLLVEEAKLIEANSHYAHMRLKKCREISMSLEDMAPNLRSLNEQNSVNEMFTNSKFCEVVLTASDHCNALASRDSIIKNNVESFRQ